MIKQMYFLMFLLISVSSVGCYTESRNSCFPDEGIKKAEIYAKVKSKKASSENRSYVLTEVIHYDKKGRSILETYPSDGEKIITVYKNDKQQFKINYRLDLPSIYTQEEKDSAIAKSNYRIDTGYVVKHHLDGRPLKIKGIDNMSWFFEYNSCKSKTQTFLKENGDTLQQFHSTYKEGILTEVKQIGMNPTVYRITRKYYGYELNKYGDWIKRKYKLEEGHEITEKRELSYY